MEKSVAVLIPCYNESRTVAKVIADFKRALPDAVIYVYDNNSTDGTDFIAKEAGAVVKYEYRQGKGNVIRSMFADIDADCYIMADGDDTYPPDNAAEMVTLVLEGKADMVIGDRLSSTYFTENKRRFHNGGNVLMRKIVNLLFHGNINDIMTGYRAFSRDFVKAFPVLSKGFEIETEMSVFALDKNFKIAELPVNYRDRPSGSVSKLNTVSDGIKVVFTALSLFASYRPLLFFSLVAAILMIISLVMFLPVLFEYFATHLVARFPTLIVSGFVALVAVVLWACGLILDSISKKHKQLFEILLKQNKQINNIHNNKYDEK